MKSPQKPSLSSLLVYIPVSGLYQLLKKILMGPSCLFYHDFKKAFSRNYGVFGQILQFEKVLLEFRVDHPELLSTLNKQKRAVSDDKIFFES